MAVNKITPGAAPVAPGNQGPLVDILAWFLLVLIILSACVRLAIRFSLGGRRRREDITICVAALFGIAQAIATSIEVSCGLGKYQRTLSPAQIGRVLKAQYSGDILYLPTLCFAQVGAFSLIEWLAASRTHKKLARYLIYFTIAWSVPATFIIAFHGGVPHPWALQSNQPIDLYALWLAISALGLVTEVILVAFPLVIIMPMQLQLPKKMVAASAFCFRIIVLAAIGARMSFLPAVKTSTKDTTYDLVGLAISTQFVLAFAITTACIPNLKPFLDAFETGLLEVSLYPRTEFSSRAGYEMGSWNQRSMTRSNAVAVEGGRPQHSGYKQDPHRSDRRDRNTRNSARRNSFDSERSDEIGIVKTAAWEVRYESAPESEGMSVAGPGPASSVEGSSS